MPRPFRERIRFKEFDPLSPRDVWRFNGHPYRWGMALIRPVKYTYILGVLAVILNVVTSIIPGVVTGLFVDEVLIQHDHTNLWLYLGLIFGVPAARGLLTLLFRNQFEYVSQHALHRMRDAIFQHLQKLDSSYYSTTPTGTIMAKLTGDLDMVRYYLAWAGYATFEQVLIFFVGGIFLIYKNWVLALAALIVIPALFITARKLEKDIHPVWQNIRQQFERLNSVVQVNITGNRITRAFVRRDYEVERFEKENLDYAEMNKVGADVRSKYLPTMDALASIMSIPVILLGGILVIREQISVGDLVVFNSLLWLLSNPTRMLGFLINDMQHFSTSATKIIELLMTKTRIASPRESDLTEDPKETEAKIIRAALTSPRPVHLIGVADEEEMLSLKNPEVAPEEKAELRRRISETKVQPKEEASFTGYVADKPFTLASYTSKRYKKVALTKVNDLVERYVNENPPVAAPLEGEVVFENVYFSYYEKGQAFQALTDISFTAKPGQTIGIIGETGSGKSSMVELIPRMADPTEGRILLDGRDLRTYPLEELRRSIGVVTQEVFLFSDSVEGNIAFVDPLMSEARVRESAQIACAHDFIEKMEEGYDTVVGERGVGLSGGQRQRISLARAVAGDPRILILDDTTSAVDMNTDTAIRENLAQYCSDKTVFIIAQRISSIRNADQILVMEKGHIVERGTHDELVQLGGIYHNIYETQVGDQEEALAILREAESKREGGNGYGTT